MSRIRYTLPNRLDQLHDELVTALPALTGTTPVAETLLDEQGRPRAQIEYPQPNLQLEGAGNDVTLTYPDALSLDRAALDAVVNAHVPLPDARPGNRQAMADRATQALANLNAAAAALAAGTATAAQQRAALELCCRTCARLVRLVLDELDTAD